MNRFIIPLLATILCVSAQEPKTGAVPAGKPEILGDAELAAQTIVIFNENDLDSAGLASFYVEQRNIPRGNLIALKTSGREEITRREYDETIADPLRKILAERGLWKLRPEPTEAGMVEETKIRFAAIIRGIPLKIAHTTADYEGDVIEGTPA